MEQQAAKPDFWDRPDDAQAVMRKLASLNEEVETWRGLTGRVADAQTLLDLAIADEDEAIAEGIALEVRTVGAEVNRLEFWLLFSGPHDKADAILAEGGMLDQLMALRAEGLIRFIGFTSEANNAAVYRFIADGRFDVMQQHVRFARTEKIRFIATEISTGHLLR